MPNYTSPFHYDILKVNLQVQQSHVPSTGSTYRTSVKQLRFIPQFSIHFRLCSLQQSWFSSCKNCGLSKYSLKWLDKWLTYFSRDGDSQYTCIDHQHGPLLKISCGINVSTSTRCSATPLPNDIPVETTPSAFDIVPGEMSLREPTPIDFLAESWAKSLSHLHHFQLIFLPSHVVSTMIDCTCITMCPSNFAINNNWITIMYTDKFGCPHTKSIQCCHLACTVMSRSSFSEGPK